MSLCFLIPISLPVFTLPAIWIIYAMALNNHHVCSISNWVYNSSCEKSFVLQSSSDLCCTLESIPLISKCGRVPPESCWFSLLCTAASFMVILIGLLFVSCDSDWSVVCVQVILIGLLRYAQVIHKQNNSMLNIEGLCAGLLCAVGLLVVGNFQVDHAKLLHYVGAGLSFPASLLFVCVQTLLSYRMTETHRDLQTAHMRLLFSTLAFTTLVLSGVFFVQESFVLQHGAAILEWLFAIIVLLFYGSFCHEFSCISAETLVALIRRHSFFENSRIPEKTQLKV